MTREDGTKYNLYWATSNLSEDGLCPHPEDYGDYYAWGETEPHYTKGHSQDNPCNDWRVIDNITMSGYSFTYYKWGYGVGNIIGYTKYNTDSSYGEVDNNLELDRGDDPDDTTIDDVARAVLGGKWRMPTDAEWKELLAKCTWTTQNGVNGCKVTGPNGNTIFLPATGFRMDTNIYYVGSWGCYWSSSLNAKDPAQAYNINFNSDISATQCWLRYVGYSVRPVTE